MWIEIDDDLFLPREAGMGLQFPDLAEFQRCQALLWSDALVDCYREVSPLSLVVVVRKSDLPRFAAAGLRYSTFEWAGTDDAAVPGTAEDRTGALIARWMPVFVERLQRERTPAR
jgi:hypothetical protein